MSNLLLPNVGSQKQKVVFIIILVLVLMFLLKNINQMPNDVYTKKLGVEMKNGTCSKGMAPLTDMWIKSQFHKFLEVYNKRPADNNTYGTKITHQFALWCFIRHLQPEFIVESGIYLGLGSWMIRQAAPAAKIIFLDPVGNSKLVYEDKINSVYLTGKRFIDFKYVAWNTLVKPSKTLVFIDDHQDHNDRIRAAVKWGFSHLVFDDNYWKSGDLISCKMACFTFLDTKYSEVYKTGKLLSTTEVLRYFLDFKEIFDKYVNTYYEFPMLWNSSSSAANPGNKNVLYSSDEGLSKVNQLLKTIPNRKDLDAYRNIAYIGLK